MRRFNVSLYVYGKDGKVIKKLDREPFSEMERVGDCVIITHNRFWTTLIEESSIVAMFIN